MIVITAKRHSVRSAGSICSSSCSSMPVSPFPGSAARQISACARGRWPAIILAGCPRGHPATRRAGPQGADGEGRSRLAQRAASGIEAEFRGHERQQLDRRRRPRNRYVTPGCSRHPGGIRVGGSHTRPRADRGIAGPGALARAVWRKGENMKRALLGLVIGGFALLLAGCTGNTDPATNVTNLSAKLNFHGTADNGPAYTYFEYWKTSTPNDKQTTPTVNWPAGASGSFGQTVTGLSPSTDYSFRVCGQDQGNSAACLSTKSFTTLA